MITFNDIQVRTLDSGLKEASVLVCERGNYTDIHLKALVMYSIYGDKDKEIKALKLEVENLSIDKRPKKINNEHYVGRCRVVQEKACIYFGLKFKDLIGKSRVSHLVQARHWAMYILRVENFSYNDIGLAFNRHHTTVMDAVKNIQFQSDSKEFDIIKKGIYSAKLS